MGRRSRVVVAFALLALGGAAFPAGAPARADEKATCSAKYQSAQRLRAAGKLTLARADLLRCAEPTCATFVSNDCKTWLAEVDGELPTLVFAVLDSNGGDVPSAVIRVDGTEVARGADGLGHAIDPGEHVVEATTGSLTFRQQIVVRVGERARRVELRPAGPSPALSDRPASPEAHPPVGAYVLGGLAIAAIAAGSVLWLTGSNAARTYNAECESTGCTVSQHDSAQRQLVAGDIGWGVGLAAGIGAIALFVLQGDTRAAAPAIAIGPLGLDGVSVTGTF
jgi:hypothetical protein